jgi:large subunit ribosomal protein L31
MGPTLPRASRSASAGVPDLPRAAFDIIRPDRAPIPGAPRTIMKPEIHPEYTEATISCACGSTFVTKSTRGSFSVDICSACHPFYTGRQKIMDSAGRIERFQKKYAKK